MAETGLLAKRKIDMSESRSYPRYIRSEAGNIELCPYGPAGRSGCACDCAETTAP
jgi:hypothetical protein